MSDENKMIPGGISFGPAPTRSVETLRNSSSGLEPLHEPAFMRKMIETGVELVKIEPGECDTLKDAFRRQTELMDALKRGDKLPEWPIDITSKYGQKLIKELIWAMVEEMAEASFILKNRSHRFTDHTDVDFAHFKEELADAFSYFMEICIYAGISHDELFAEYCRKNYIVKKRVEDGY